MAEILKEWLTDRLNRPIQWEPLEFGNMMKNGRIVASVLLSYHVINEEKHYLIRDTNAVSDINNNWHYLAEWLKYDLDIHLADADITSIKEGKGSALLRLFYQLFLTLDKRDRTDFIKKERKMVSNLVDKMNQRFLVNKVPEADDISVDYLSKPLLNEQHFIEWQRKKTKEVKDAYDFMKHRYKKILEKIGETKTVCPPTTAQPVKKLDSKEKRDLDNFALKHPCKYENYTYEELLSLEEKSESRRKSLLDTDWAKNYMDELYTRLYKRTDSEEFQKQIRIELNNEMWDDTIAEEESQVDLELARKVMKLSQFEKQMCTQLMETKQQARNLVKNRVDAEKEFAQQRDLQFSQYLDSLKEQIHAEVAETDFEKHRQEMLHRKLYDEKMKRKRQHYYEICYETVLALVDYATKYAYFRILIEDEIPEHFIHEWKTLFFRHQPIFDIFEPMEDLVKESPLEEEQDSEIEEIIRLELDRQDALNSSEFIEYRDYEAQWRLDSLLPNYDPESEERKEEYLGSRILGHVVYTLLEVKYPYPPPRPPADLPRFHAKGLIRGVPDKAITLAMQTLLDLRKIVIVRLETAINYCLRSFKIDMIGIENIDVNYEKFISAAPEEEGKDFARVLKHDEEAYTKSTETALGITPFGPIPSNCKQTQTPKTLPEDEMVLSPAAELGKYAYEALSFGDSVTDHLLAAILVEYIKSQKNINGFVIINYPNSYREAAILEETFSGREPPPEEDLEDRDDIYLEEAIIKHRKKEKDVFINIRKSNLVSDPHKKKVDVPFESYFTCYIRLIHTEDILQECFIWYLTIENSELIDRFYAALGINYSMYYETVEKQFLSQMCKYLIGDLALPMKSFDTLFGINVLSDLDFPATTDGKSKSKIFKPEASSTRAKGKRKNRSTSQDLHVVKSAVSDELQEETHIAAEAGSIEEREESLAIAEEAGVEILPGDVDWTYGELPMTENLALALATCWEQIEKTYIHDLEQLLFSKRLQMNCLVPYTRFIRDKMDQIIKLPSFKQEVVSQFQLEFNEFDDDWRDVNITKNEWHCRIKELQRKLYTICDERKIFAEQQKHALILDNWAVNELTTMVNTYISCMQSELNRSVLTYQTLHDFYITLLKKMPSNERLVSKDLIKINNDMDDDKASTGGKKNAEDKVFKQLRNAYQELLVKDIGIDYANNPFNLIIETNVKFAQKVIKDLNDHYRGLIGREYNEQLKSGPGVKKKDDARKEESIQESILAQETFKENVLKCIQEWTMGVNGEMHRLNQRLLALQYKCYHDMKLFSDHVFKAFMRIQNDINAYYANEIKSVDRLCKYFQMAVENGKKIQETLVLDGDTFVIDPNLLQFPNPEPRIVTGDISEFPNDSEFKVSQLVRLRDLFKIVAPTGLALQQAFIYLLQDFVFFGKESCEGPLVPETWRNVDPEEIPKLVFLLFGETAYIDWRDFLIYCLNIRFPVVEELLELRHELRCKDPNSTELISRDDFMKQELWFEKDFDPDDPYAQLRRSLVKHFIFELYETSEDYMNYSAFLLAFCKHLDPAQGLASALSMAIGKKTCSSLEDCEEVICKLIKQKQYKDECLACANKCTGEFLNKLIDNVIQFCEGITISEISSKQASQTQTTKKSTKKGLKASKSGKMDSARNESSKAQSTKTSVSGEDIPAPPPSETKQTYICRPCEDEPQVEKLYEPEEEALEDKSSVQEDLTLAYTVSQDVIWNVLKICLPWHFELFPEEKMTPYVEMVQEVMKKLEVNHEKGDMYVAMFLANPNICKFLNKVRKFTSLSIVEEVRKVCI